MLSAQRRELSGGIRWLVSGANPDRGFDSRRLAVMALTAAISVAAFASAYLAFANQRRGDWLIAMLGSAGLALLSSATMFAVDRRMSWAARERLRELTETTRLAASGTTSARVDATTEDAFRDLAAGINAALDRAQETLQSEIGQKQALLAIIKAVESSGDAIAVGDSSRTGIYFNKRFLDLFEYSSEELNVAGGTSSLYVDASAANLVAHLVNRGEAWGGEVEMRARNGRIIPVAVRVDPIKDQSGKVTGRIEILSDITERRANEKLNSSLHRISELASGGDSLEVFYSRVHQIVGELIDATNFHIALYDSATDIVSFPYYVDSNHETPAPRPRLRGLTEYVMRINHPLLAGRDTLQSLAGVGEIEMIGAQPLSWAGVPLRSGEQVIGVLAVQSYTDEVKFSERDLEVMTFVAQQIVSAISRNRAEEALRVSEEKYRTILLSIEDGYYEVDLRGSLTFFNDAVCRILGYPPEEALGLNHRKYMEESAYRAVENAFNAVYRTGEPRREYPYEIRRKDGVTRFVETSITLRRNSDTGEAEGFRGVIRDVTERRQAQEGLARNLGAFLTIVSSVSDGDLTCRGVQGDDTLGQVIGSVNRMLDNFSSMLTEVKHIGLSVSSNATEILAASEQIAVGSQRQADEITNTSSGVEEMAASMNQVSKNAEASAEAGRRAFELAELGDKSVRDTSEAMSRIDDAVQQTAEKMKLLGVRSSEISEIIDLIDEIAAQTNLLALNAAIEAAHAGEAGLGFSVVAEEIRKLAERSARATRDVGSLIKSIQAETQEALAAMEVGTSEVKVGTELASEASRALQDISNAVRQSSELMEEISAASEEQARVTRNLASAMQTISSITLETSAGAHETAHTFQGMVALSEQLNKAISQFRVRDDFVHPFSYGLQPPRDGRDGTRTEQPSRGD